MKVRVAHCELQTATSDERFEALRVVRATVESPQPGGGVLDHAAVPCREGELKPGVLCARCPHLLTAFPDGDGGHSVTVRCMFLESDPVARVMTPAERVVAVDAAEPLSVAAARASDHGVSKLLVLEDGEVVGVVDAAEAAQKPRAAQVARHTRWPIPVIPRTMPLGQVAQVLRESGHDFLVVLDGEEVAGTVTRGGLRDLAVPDL
jgi:CBS domain-containing protein